MYIYKKYAIAKTSSLNTFRGQNVQGYMAVGETSVAKTSYNKAKRKNYSLNTNTDLYIECTKTSKHLLLHKKEQQRRETNYCFNVT